MCSCAADWRRLKALALYALLHPPSPQHCQQPLQWSPPLSQALWTRANSVLARTTSGSSRARRTGWASLSQARSRTPLHAASSPTPGGLFSGRNECDGLTDYAAGIVVRLGVPRERANLEHAVRTAWLRARDAAPIIACTFTRGADSDWRFQYTVPTSDTAAAWAHETTKFHAEPAILEDMVENLINRPRAIGGGHFNLDLHVAPASDEPDAWNIAYDYSSLASHLDELTRSRSVHALHAFLDGRACMMLLEHLLDNVADIFEKGEGSAPQWGDEVTRLAPAMAACVEFSSKALDAPPAAPEAASNGAPALVCSFLQCYPFAC
jgi:hypothetical protein